MLSHQTVALAAIHAAFAEPVVYSGAGLDEAAITAVPTEAAADAYQGPGATTRKQAFEVPFSFLPSDPSKTDTLVHDGLRWRVNDITRRDDVAAWLLVVERAPQQQQG
jgi:hypothetical protein